VHHSNLNFDTMPLIIIREPLFILHHFHHKPIFNKLTQTIHFQCNEKLEIKIMHEEFFFLCAFQTKTNLSSYTNITNIGILSGFFVFSKNQQKDLCHCITTIFQMSKVLHLPYSNAPIGTINPQDIMKNKNQKKKLMSSSSKTR